MFTHLDALKANNLDKKIVQQHQQWLWSRVLTAHNTPNGTISGVPRNVHYISYVRLTLVTQRCLVVTFGEVLHEVFFTSDMHSAWGCASQTPCKTRSRVGTHLSKLWTYTGNWAKSRGWALFPETRMLMFCLSIPVLICPQRRLFLLARLVSLLCNVSLYTSTCVFHSSSVMLLLR